MQKTIISLSAKNMCVFRPARGNQTKITKVSKNLSNYVNNFKSLLSSVLYVQLLKADTNASRLACLSYT